MTDSLIRPEEGIRDPSFAHGINRIAIAADGKRFATSDVDMNVAVVDGDPMIFSENFSSINEKIKPLDRIRGLAFSPEGDLIYIAASDHVLVFSLTDRSLFWSYLAPRSFGFLIISPISLDVAKNGDVAASFDNGTVVVWDRNGNIKSKWHDNDAPRILRFVAGGERIVGTDSFSLCVWDPKAKKRKTKIGVTERVYALDVDPLGTIAATRTLHDIVVWDLANRDILSVIPVDPGIPILAVHPTKPWIAFGELNKVKIVDTSGKLIAKHEIDASSALSMVFDPLGDVLWVGCTGHVLVKIPVGGMQL